MIRQVQSQDVVLHPINELTAFKLNQMRSQWIDQKHGVQVIEGRLIEKPEEYTPWALLFSKEMGWTEQNIQKWLDQNPQYKPLPTLPKAPLVEAVTLTEKMRRRFRW